MAKYFEIPDPKVDELLATDLTDLVNQQELTEAINQVPGSVGSPIPSIDAQIDPLGVLKIPRAATEFVIFVDTSDGGATDNLLDIQPSGAVDTFVDGDKITIRQKVVARVINIISGDPATSIAIDQDIVLDETGAFAALVRQDGRWYNTGEQFPARSAIPLSKLELDSEDLIISDFIPETIAVTKSKARVTSAKTGETPASGTIQITATTGTVGSITAQSNEGAGTFTLGIASYSAATTPATLAAALRADIEARRVAGDHDYTSSVLTDTVTISAPPGRGAAGNSYTLSQVPIGGVTAIVVDFAGGIDGSFQNSDLVQIDGETPDRALAIFNDMPSNSITLQTSGNIAASYKLLPGEWLFLIFDGSAWVPQREVPTIKAGSEPGASFTGNPEIFDVVFTTPFVDADYSISVAGEEAFTWSVENKVASGFRINTNQNSPFSTDVDWVATAHIDP